MKLSRKCEYACLALITLSINYNKQLSKLGEISEQNQIPRKFLEQILTVLKSANYVQSIRGPKGGYTLVKSPSEISLAEIVRLFDGPIGASTSVSEHFYRESPIEKNNNIHKVFKEIRDIISDKLENTFFSDLI